MLNLDITRPSIKKPESALIYGEWHPKLIRTATGEILKEEFGHNLIVISGRQLMMGGILGLTSATWIALGIGPSATPATVNDTRLTYELIGNANRKSLTSVINPPNPLSYGTDVILNNYTDPAGNLYYAQCSCRGTYVGATDGNMNQPVQEFGLFTTATLPGTPTGTSGTMLNHFIAQNQYELTVDVTLIVDTILHL